MILGGFKTMKRINKIEGVSVLKQKEYVKAENKAHDYLIECRFLPQGITADFKKVCVFEYEHPEYMNNPNKCGKFTVHYFDDWQEAVEKLCK